MIKLTNNTAQVVQPGGTLQLNDLIFKTGSGECYQSRLGAVKLRANGIYEIHFSANITGDTAGTPVQLAIALGGIALPESVMVYTPAAANAFGSVSTSVPIRNCCGDFDRVTIVNTGTVPVTVSGNLIFWVKRDS